MDLPEYISRAEVQRVCTALGLRDWTALSEAKITLAEAQKIQAEVGAEARQIPAEEFQQGLEVELEHGLQFSDTNVTNNHPLLTGKIVTAHLKESLDYYLRLQVAELEGDLLKASHKEDADKLLAVYRKLVKARATLAKREAGA
ncbi:MAG TPA: DUF5661 family protein [Anaerolineales bacterium]|nr:DUF5661 family protein [Anaerolineales bacterium]